MTAMAGYLAAFVIGVLITPIALYWWTKNEEDTGLESKSTIEGEI